VKPLGRRAHGFVDYGTAVTELTLAAALPLRRPTRIVLVASGVNAALLGALTNYELGVLRLIPMRAHLALDSVFAATFLAAAGKLAERPRGRILVAALGLVGASATALTDPERA
jgi:hypothetical protein